MSTYTYITPLLMVFDMKASLQFYVDGLGFEVEQQAGPEGDIGWVMLKHNGLYLMLNTLYELHDRPVKADSLRTQHHCDTILYIGCEDLDRLYHHLKAKGLHPSLPQRTGYGFEALEIEDPDGYTVVFQRRA